MYMVKQNQVSRSGQCVTGEYNTFQEQFEHRVKMQICSIKTLSLNLALTLGCLNPKNLNPSVTNPNPDHNSNPYPNNCGYESN